MTPALSNQRFVVPRLIMVVLAGGLLAAGCNSGSKRGGSTPPLPPPTPTLSVSPTAIGTSTSAGSTPQAQTVTIRVGGDLSVTWNLSSSAAWLTASKSSGQGDAVVALTLDPAGLTAGQHTGQATVRTSSKLNATIQVTLTVTAVINGQVAVSPATLTFDATDASLMPPAQTLTVQAASGNFWAASAAETWIQITPVSGIGNTQVSVQIDATGLSAGQHQGQIKLESSTHTALVPVTLNMTVTPGPGPSPNLAPTATTQTPTGIQNGDVALSYTLSDPESDACSVQVEFSRDGGVTFTSATPVTGGNGTTNLTSSVGGVTHTFNWDSLVDGVALEDVIVRVTPNDGTQDGSSGSTTSFSVANPVAKLADLNSVWWPDGLPATWHHVKLGYAAAVVAEAQNSFAPWIAVFLKKGATSGEVRGIKLQLLVRDAVGNVTVVAEDDWTAQREVAWGIWSSNPWFGSQVYSPGWLSHPAAADGAHFRFTVAGTRPDAAPDEIHHAWLAIWGRPTIPAGLRATSVEIGVRVVLEVSGDAVVAYGMDRYETALITGTSIGNGQWEHLVSGWFYSADGSPQILDMTKWTSLAFQ